MYPGTFLTIGNGTIFTRHVESDLPANVLSVFYTAEFLDSFHHTFSDTCEELLSDPFSVVGEPGGTFFETLYPLCGDMYYNLKHVKNCMDTGTEDDLLMSEYLYHCLFNFYRIYHTEIILKSERLTALKKSCTREELFKRINIAKDYIISNYNKPILLEEVCRHSCLSESYFFRIFRQVFNCTPHRFLTEFRLSQAKRLLRYTDFEIKEIVSEIGFECDSSFTRLFKTRFGIPPSYYRKTLLQD